MALRVLPGPAPCHTPDETVAKPDPADTAAADDDTIKTADSTDSAKAESDEEEKTREAVEDAVVAPVEPAEPSPVDDPSGKNDALSQSERRRTAEMLEDNHAHVGVKRECGSARRVDGMRAVASHLRPPLRQKDFTLKAKEDAARRLREQQALSVEKRSVATSHFTKLEEEKKAEKAEKKASARSDEKPFDVLDFFRDSVCCCGS